MNQRDPFFIGWQNEMPETNRNFLRKWLIPLFVLAPLMAIALILVQKPFNKHRFELGNIVEVTGQYYHSPFPMLIAEKNSLKAGLSNEILLVGYGKFGAEGTMQSIQDEHGELSGKKVTLLGSLIYGDGKTLMELTKGPASFVRAEDVQFPNQTEITKKSKIKVVGEILDPKCYFGVMKPGEGKIHKSCAIRCISGGIPPVFRHETGKVDKPYQYYLMVDKDGNKINQEVLPYVAEHITLKGETARFNNWDILFLDVNYQFTSLK